MHALHAHISSTPTTGSRNDSGSNPRNDKRCYRFDPATNDTKHKGHPCGCPLCLVPVVGVEPTRYRYHWILSPARLPIPSHRRMNQSRQFTLHEYIININSSQYFLKTFSDFFSLRFRFCRLSSARPRLSVFQKPRRIRCKVRASLFFHSPRRSR